jgi:hypothetical protein
VGFEVGPHTWRNWPCFSISGTSLSQNAPTYSAEEAFILDEYKTKVAAAEKALTAELRQLEISKAEKPARNIATGERVYKKT